MSSLAHSVFSALVVQFLCLPSLAVSYPDCPVLGLFLWCSILKPSNWWSQFVTLTNVCITSVIYSFMPCPGGRSRAFIASSNATVDRQTRLLFSQDNYKLVWSYSGSLISLCHNLVWILFWWKTLQLHFLYLFWNERKIYKEMWPLQLVLTNCNIGSLYSHEKRESFLFYCYL